MVISLRLFIAISLPESWTAALHSASAVLRKHSLHGSFTRRENFHLTLAFLGNLASPAPAQKAMSAVEAAPFILRATAPGRFCRPDGDVWWVGIAPCPGLSALQRELCIRLRAAGLSVEERPFIPHLTLGRRVTVQDSFSPRLLESVLPSLEVPVDSFSLMQSEQRGGILRYTPIYRRSLGVSSLSRRLP